MRDLKETWSSGRKIYWGIILFLAYFFLNMFFYDETLYFKAVFTLIMAVFSLVLTLRATRNEKKITKFIKSYTSKSLSITYLLLLIILTVIVSINIGSSMQTEYLLFSLIISCALGVFDESIGRGLLLGGFIGVMNYRDEKYTMTKAAIFSSVLYSTIYLINVMFIPFNSIIQQVVCMCSIGIIMSFVKAKTGNLLLPIVIHFFINWGSFGLVNSEIINWLIILGIYMPLTIFSLLYLSKIDQQLTA